MPNDDQLDRKAQEQLRACAEHSWANDRHRRQFESIGIRSDVELKLALEKAIKDPQTRSFERQPDPARGQTEPSKVFQVTLGDQKQNQHQVTVILNPDRDKEGKVHGGTAYVNDPDRRTDISRLLRDQYEKGNDPKVLMRGAHLNLSEEQAKKSPISRLDNGLGGLAKPTLEREKQVTPPQERQEQGRKTKEQMTLLERLQQAKPDISREIAERDRQRQMSRSHELGR